MYTYIINTYYIRVYTRVYTLYTVCNVYEYIHCNRHTYICIQTFKLVFGFVILY